MDRKGLMNLGIKHILETNMNFLNDMSDLNHRNGIFKKKLLSKQEKDETQKEVSDLEGIINNF